MLKEKVVIVTGASSGFGEDVSRGFARQGCKIILAARRLEKLNSLADEIREEGGMAHPVQADITMQADIERLIDTVLMEFGRVDILFNNAGFGRLDWLENLNEIDDINAMLDVNLRGLIQLTRVVLPTMLDQRSGVIINMASIAGLIPAPLYSVYSATKFGVRGFTEALRQEVKPFGIKVCAIYPGGAATEFSRHTGNSEFKRNVKTPEFIRMTSAYVARKVVNLARHPRRSVIIPYWMKPVVWINWHFPWLTDLAVRGMVKKYHHVP